MRERHAAIDAPCALCGNSIDYGLSARDSRMAYSLDHIHPLSLGGALLDPDNVRATHVRCNSRKGDRLPRNGNRPRTAW